MDGYFASWCARWGDADALPIPLIADSKKPIANHWQTTPPADQWAKLDTDWQGNLGVLCGNGLAVIDCDDTQAVTNVQARLTAMGLTPPAVRTPSGGRHYYTKVDAPTGVNTRLLAPTLGKGELRVRNAYVVAPCSTYQGMPYAFVSGAPEDLRTIPVLAWRELAWLVPSDEVQPRITEPPIRLLKRAMPERARTLFRMLAGAPAGKAIDRYGSRSEAEAAVVCNLILAGFSFDDVCRVFQERMPAHYADKGQYRESYLLHTYESARRFLGRTLPRPDIGEEWQLAQAMPWPGRPGLTDQAVYLALLAIAWQCGRWDVAASVRDLAEHSALSIHAVSDALRRLTSAGLIKHEQNQRREAREASTWSIRQLKGTTVTYVPDGCMQDDHQELWAQKGLGRSARGVYSALTAEPASIDHLAQQTGKHRNTVSKALRELFEHGLSDPAGHGWVRGATSLQDVAAKLGADRAAQQRRQEHDCERAAYAKRQCTRGKESRCDAV